MRDLETLVLAVVPAEATVGHVLRGSTRWSDREGGVEWLLGRLAEAQRRRQLDAM
jgi:hypothetical protein